MCPTNITSWIRLENAARMYSLPAGRTQAWIGLLDTCDDWQGVVFPIGGEDVISLGVAEGPRVGELLAQVEDWWDDGDYAADCDDCLEKLKSLLDGET